MAIFSDRGSTPLSSTRHAGASDMLLAPAFFHHTLRKGELRMNEIYVTGHRNPDTDSIVAAMSYAALKNALGEKEYVAVHLGTISDETNRMLERFHFQPPRFIQNVRTQVSDLDYDTPPALNATVTMDRAWHIMREQRISAIPVVNEDGTLYGTLSAGDIATFSMETLVDSHVEELPVFNLVSVLEGRIVNEGSGIPTSISGNVVVAMPQAAENLRFSGSNNIVLCASQPDMIRRALDQKVSCLIICRAEIDPNLENYEGDTCIISTPFPAGRVCRLIYQAIPISRPCQRGEIVCFHLDDYIDDVREVVLKSRYRSYPVLDENEKVVGTLSRYHLLRPRRKQVVLVDHNEVSQSVPGLDQAEILEIIDHHRLADIQTSQPIYVRNEPVGSTNTIIAAMYQEHGVIPSGSMAGLMAAAILSDTVMFKSPTCTQRDIDMANRMARIANVSLEELGKAIFSATCGDERTVDAMLKTDYKEFHIAGHDLAVSQITCMDSDRLLLRTKDFLTAMGAIRKARGLDTVVLMITDVLLEGTQLLFTGDEDTIRQAFNIKSEDNCAFLPKIMSRKKQVIPMLSDLWS